MGAQIINFRPSGDHEWTKWAACSTTPIPNMYPAPTDTRGLQIACDRCAVCPVRSECLTDALSRGENEGVWGGLTADERRHLRRNNRRVATKTGTAPVSAADLADLALQDLNEGDVA